ncbi:hypothetical protein VOI54_03900 [Tamlana sp. 2201CG12-4]|uniref:hypothetical protein n=1 Tax=Tamlana sp. 2201CG12-4 TaxID=3112582 RepID=UPI002DB9240D|nr:hypothetical protein [Tamlana sp. 2201CG12-4]MEC3906147.1 hypothetical protein [Tamlana sp. 2201CG12-4]
MKSISGDKESLDPNKFYLVSDEYKKRVKPLDVRHNYAAGWIFIGFDWLVESSPKDKTLQQVLFHKPEITDTFKDYKIEGYEDAIPSLNLGTKKEPIYFCPYLDHKELKSCKMDLYFSLPKDLKVFKIYYGKEIIADTRIK